MQSHFKNFFKDKNSSWPHSKMESWKYYDFKKIKSDIFDFSVNQLGLEISFSNKVDENTIVFNPDQVILSHSLRDFCEVSLLKKNTILNQKSTLDQRISNVNFQSEWLKVKFIRPFKLSEPLQIKYISFPDQIFHPSLQIEALDSHFTLIEDFSHVYAPLSSCHLQMKLTDSFVEHIILHYSEKENLNPFFQNQEIQLHASQYSHIFFGLKREALRQQISVSMSNEGCQAHLNGFNVSDKQQFSEVRSEVMHHKPNCHSRQLFKTLVSGRATSVFNGRVFVAPEAQKTDSAQLCKGLLLSPQARINAKPELEIYADDVKASHGAAIGQMSSDQIFYLISRGMNYDEAHHILAQSYVGEILNQVSSSEWRQKIQKIISIQIKDISSQLIENLREKKCP